MQTRSDREDVLFSFAVEIPEPLDIPATRRLLADYQQRYPEHADDLADTARSHILDGMAERYPEAVRSARGPSGFDLPAPAPPVLRRW